VILFFALIGAAVAIAGALGFLFFWAMAQVHLRDRHATNDAAVEAMGFASPRAIAWLLRGGYRKLADPGLSGLALPAQWSLWAVIVGLVAAGTLAALAQIQ